MDVLLSLPIVSYLLGPGATTSWSTSINVLFFYLTWSTLVLSYAPLHIELAGVLTLRILFWLLPSLFFLGVDIFLPSLAANVKFGGANALPPRDGRRITQLLLLAAINLALEAVLQAGLQVAIPALSTTVSALLAPKPTKAASLFSSISSLSSLSPYRAKASPAKPLFKTASTLPLPWQVFKQICLLFAGREALVYYVHRFLLSNPDAPPSRYYPASLVRRLSRWHLSSFAHARGQAPFSLLLFADHPASVFFLRWLPLYGAALVVRPHLLVFFLFTGLVTFEETMGMSGYSIVPGLLLRGIARRTAAHYTEGGGGGVGAGSRDTTTHGVDFGAWGILDWAQGTSWPRSSSILQDAKASVVVPGLGALQDAAATVTNVVAGEKDKVGEAEAEGEEMETKTDTERRKIKGKWVVGGPRSGRR